MTLPSGFHFSQSNLQDYLECQRRFQLRYLLHIAWPALETQPASEKENILHMGAEFHYLIRQHITGVPVELLSSAVRHTPQSDQTDLVLWWENYLSAIDSNEELGSLFHPSPPLTARLFPEINLSVPISGHRLIAKYDLLVSYSTGAFTIIDWKTNHLRPKRQWLQDRMQTRIYLYTLAKSGMCVGGNLSIKPEQIEMLYWFANFPADPETIIYSSDQMILDETYLLDLIVQIDQKHENGFPLAHDDQHCRFCVYRSLCDRGTIAGSLLSSEDLDAVASLEDTIINMVEIDEIEF